MNILPFSLLLFCWIASEQERFIGNVALSGEFPPPDEESRFFLPNYYRRNISFLMLAIYAICQFTQTSASILGWLALAVSFAFIARLQDWHHLILWKSKNVVLYYLALWLIILDFIALGLSWLFLPEWLAVSQQALIAINCLWFMLCLYFWRTWAKH